MDESKECPEGCAGYIKDKKEKCKTKFQKKDILYYCKKCDDYYCFSCFCRDHFDKHCGWKAFKNVDGKLVSVTHKNKIIKGFPPKT